MKTEQDLIFEAYAKPKTLSEDLEEDESVGDSSDFEDKAEKFADSIGDAELEYLVNLSGGEFEILKGFLQDQMGYRDLGQYKRN
mgnify:CR=1 FL=1